MFPIRDYNITLDVNGEFSQQPLKVKAGDTKSSVINIQLLDDFNPVDLTGLTIKFIAKKPDGNIVWQTPDVVDAIQGKIQVVLFNQTIAVAGLTEVEVSVYGNDGERLTFFVFGIEVDETIDPNDAIASENMLIALDEVIADKHTHPNKELLDKLVYTGTADVIDLVNLTIDFAGMLAEKADKAHAHDMSDINGLSLALTNKADVVHSHDGRYYQKAEVDTALQGKANTIHGHAMNDVTGLQTALDAKADNTSVSAHTSKTDNPHGVTKAQIGLANVDNTADLNKPVSTAMQTALNGKSNTDHNHDGRYYTEAEVDNALTGKANTSHTHVITNITGLQSALDSKSDINHTHTNYADKTALDAHVIRTDNPHGTTKAQIGLGNVDNTTDLNKPVSTATQTALNGKADTNHTHTAGVISFDKTGTNFANTNVQAVLGEINATLGNVFVGKNVRGSQYVSDVNSIVRSGFYYSVDTTNNPVRNNGFLIHNQFSELDTYSLQIFVEYSTDTMYIRRKVNAVWKAWVIVPTGIPVNPVKYLTSNFTTSTAGATSFPVGVAYDIAKDTIHIYINGLKLIKGKHFTADSTNVTLLNGAILQTMDDVLIEVHTSTL